MSDGNCRRCHIDQIRKRESSLLLDESILEDTSETIEHSTDFTIVPICLNLIVLLQITHLIMNL